MEFEIKKHSEKQAVIKLVGRLDDKTAEKFKTDLKGITTDGLTNFLVDMEAVSVIDSSGLSALVSGFKAIRGQGGTVVLANVGPQTKAALEMARLNRIFSIHTDVASALESFRETPLP